MRSETVRICFPLEVEDHVIQSMPDVSPPKWHLAHTSWFFETFLLKPYLKDYREYDARYAFLFNSYYEAVGQRIARDKRGMLSRPSVEEIHRYRQWIDRHMIELLADEMLDAATRNEVQSRTVLGLHHEQQHQELLMMDIKHILWSNPLRPAYLKISSPHLTAIDALPSHKWLSYDRGLTEVGDREDSPFSFDHERPRHSVYVQKFRLCGSPVLNSDFMEFIEAGGYVNPSFWLSDGFAASHANGWTSPLYWESEGGSWQTMTFEGMRPVREHEPVCHISFFEADAYARFKGLRLPTEFEWEHAVSKDADQYQGLGRRWEWTSSSYHPYPGFKPLGGELGEYNGKFMSGQMVLRGGSEVTPRDHMRVTYRNYFSPASRWAFNGARLAT